MRNRSSAVVLLSTVILAACGPEAARPAARSPEAQPVARSPAGLHMTAKAPPGPEDPDGPITPALRAATVDRLLRLLGEKYVFPDKATQAKEAILARSKRGEYDAIGTGKAFAAALTGHVNQVLHDAHFRVGFSADKIPENELSAAPTPEEQRRYDAEARRFNGGFEKVERLPGNIGYLEVRSFSFPDRGADAAAAAMTFLADTDALIIDIRRNGGGEPDMVATLCSYFFSKPVHLNDLYYRPENETRQYWSLPSVPGRRYLDKEVYVLVGKQTGSGAEEFAYDLQQLKRATLVGEPTWGGANPGDELRLSDHFSAFIPTGRAINPSTKTNWEGVGVAPDIKVPADEALRVAQIKALEKRAAIEKEPRVKRALEARLLELRGK
jgi:retinol-binding protein 3